MAEHKFPTEVIDLPSLGKVYPKDSPLADGKIELKYMTTKEEDILMSQNLIKKGVVIDKLLDSLIVTEGVTQDDLLLGDKNAVLVGARVLAYGKDYDFYFIDEYGEQVKRTADLTKLAPQDYDFSKYEKGINSFSFTLPKTERVLTFSIPTHKDEIEIDVEVEAIKKVFKDDTEAISRESSTRLKYLIKSVDGKTDRKTINEFVDNEFLSVDSRAFRSFVSETSPNLDFKVEVKNSRGEKEKVAVPMTAQFFWPDTGV